VIKSVCRSLTSSAYRTDVGFSPNVLADDLDNVFVDNKEFDEFL